MVVKPDGTKWACQSCLKGHRVSGCTHTDRELTLVPKKGRPVTQCQHCRLERKKRSAHVKCDCGEAEKPHHPKEKCIHLREAEERAKAGFSEPLKKEDAHHLIAVAEEQGCCCHHGGKCSCSLIKKEPSSDGGTPPHGPAVPKPRLETTKSDGSLTVFANGHHKPVHKRNHAAHECGMPYKMPMPRAQTEQNINTQARRSVDSLALDSNMPWNPAAMIQQAKASQHKERRMSKSEQPSPKQPPLSGCSGGLSDNKLSSIDFSSLGPIQTNQSYDSAASDNAFPPLDPMSGITDASYDPWSAFPSADSNVPNNNPFGVWATAFDFSNTAQPALTAASSGTQSEIDELPTMDDLYGYPMPSIQEDMGSFGDDMAGGDSNSNRRSLPPNFFGNTDFTMPDLANDWQTPVNGLPGSDDGKSKSLVDDQSLGLPEAWNTPTMPSMTSIAQRPAVPTSNPGRPQSHSVGPGSAPNDDMIRSLFPEFDFENAMLEGNSPTAMESSTKRMGGMAMNTSADVGPMDETTAFTTQPWSDGSLSVPADNFTSPYNLDQDFSSQDFTGNWYQ
ncbi:hypothetical protein M409DRAFT_49369 [Zasmidium cellare ATCC 36951]|uniref:Copper-fist domain-containing protein n=1 Tax=Zasmidium cellare ATCC 36951 TaxID=1080233 RepID=A0A6A6D383_ZASCE|nr:uncharacterized protein M409DRAFT_49369 [Zasmidium cellare ATCC 36951]KAF2172850.1 hypothetical protein M409DRAFT_49369 [Zasmidium cellare ATCC 36951]